MNTAMSFLSANWDRLALHEFGVPADLASVLITPRFQTSAHVVFLLLDRESSEPRLVIKVARQGTGKDSALAREAANLHAVQALRPGGFDSIPRLIAFEAYAGTQLLLETALPGRVLRPSDARRRPNECAQALLDWVTALHLASAHRSIRPSVGGEPWSDPLDRLVRDNSLSAEDAALVARTRELLDPLRRKPWPVVFEHGDLSAPNILVTELGALNVVDWELANPAGLPAQDLFFSLAFLAFARSRATGPRQYVDAFARAFFGPSAWTRPYIERYADCLHLDRDLLPSLFVACWSSYVARRVDRLTHSAVNSGTPDERWMSVKRNHYFALWSHAVNNIDAFSVPTRGLTSRVERVERKVPPASNTGRSFSIAVIGPDGAGKTTITRMLESSRVMRLKYLYMGINTSSSNIALPTSRLIERLKRRPRGPSAPRTLHAANGAAPSKRRGMVWATARLANRLAEQSFRQCVAWSYQLRGYVVLYDRHFVFDFGGAPAGQRLPWDRRLYQWCVARFSPRPDLVILLDAPGAVLFARKGESTIEELEDRRQRLLRQGKELPAFVVVDATRPLQTVYDDVVNHILAFRTDPGGYVARIRALAETNANRRPATVRETGFASIVTTGAADE